MTEQEENNARIVMRHFTEACAQGRHEVWLEIMHPDYFIHHPWCNPGRDNYLASSKVYWDAVSLPEYDFLHVMARDDMVMVHYIERGTILGPLFGEQTVGKPYAKKGFGLYRLDGGLMREGWNQEDDLGFKEQIGATAYAL